MNNAGIKVAMGKIVDWIADKAPDCMLPAINWIRRVIGLQGQNVHIYFGGKRIR